MKCAFRKEYDVIVAGAGIAGVAAALATARRGLKTALVEKQTLIGGLATSGLIYIYLPLCDGAGHQVTFGIAEELLKDSLAYSPFDLAPQWGGPENGNFCCPLPRYQCRFSPAGFTLALDKALLEAEVDLWLETLVCGAETDDAGRVSSVDVVNASGFGKLAARYFVDATGNCSLVSAAGGATVSGENYLTPWIMEANPKRLQYHLVDSISINPLGDNPKFKVPSPVDGRGVTDFIRGSWRTCREHYDSNYASGAATRKELFPVHLPAMPQFRKISRIQGMETLGTGQEWKNMETSIGIYGDWRNNGKVWETPYGTLVPKEIKGVLAAGRNISTDDDAWEAFRVIPSAAMTGEVAGVAAAMAVQGDMDASELNVEALRAELRKNGFRFHLQEVGLEPR